MIYDLPLKLEEINKNLTVEKAISVTSPGIEKLAISLILLATCLASMLATGRLWI